MEYSRTYWQAREGTKLNKYQKVNETTTTVELVNAPDAITIAGTEVTTGLLNNMESGIDGAVAGVNEIQGVVDFTSKLNTPIRLYQASLYWYAMTTRGNDVYCCVKNGDIYKQTGGTGDFIALNQTARSWEAMTTFGDDVYACDYGGDIYKQTGGTGDFIALGFESKYWTGITSNESHIYACVAQYVYMVDMSTSSVETLYYNPILMWSGIAASNGFLYLTIHYGDIYKYSLLSNELIPLNQTDHIVDLLRGPYILNGDVYVCGYDDLYVQNGGVGNFVGLGQGGMARYDITSLGDILYVCVNGFDIYTATILTGNTFRASSSFTLPAMPDGARKRILNTHATNAITVTANSGTTIEGQATMTLSAGHEVEIELIGTDWRRVVLSQSVTPSAGKAMIWPENASGTFAPTVTFGDASTGITYTRQLGRWQRIGNRIDVSITIVFSSKGSATGQILISGLPISCGANQEDRGGFQMFGSVLSLGYLCGVIRSVNNSQISMFTYDTTGTEVILNNTHFTNTSAFRVVGSYYV